MTWLCLLLYKSSLSKHRCPGLRLPNSNLSSGPTQSTAMSLQQLERNLWTPGLTHHGAHHPAHVDRSAAARAVLASILQELGVGVQEHQANIQDPIFKLSEGADSEDPQPLQPPPHLLPLTQQPGRECRGRKCVSSGPGGTCTLGLSGDLGVGTEHAEWGTKLLRAPGPASGRSLSAQPSLGHSCRGPDSPSTAPAQPPLR